MDQGGGAKKEQKMTSSWYRVQRFDFTALPFLPRFCRLRDGVGANPTHTILQYGIILNSVYQAIATSKQGQRWTFHVNTAL